MIGIPHRIKEISLMIVNRLIFLLEQRHTARILTATLFVFVIANAWIGDDAYISFRSIDNFVNGYGLVYNPGERVQAYTNTLLVLVLIPLHYLTHGLGIDSIYYVSILFSLLHLIIFVIVMKKLAASRFWYSLGLVLLLTHYSISDYFTSGLENSLNFMLVLMLISAIQTRKVSWIMLLSSLLVLSRYDLAGLVIPLVVFILYKDKTPRKWVYFLMNFFLPIFTWVVISVYYYGSLLPNSIVAKSHFQPAKLAIIIHDLGYIWGSEYFHPLSFLGPLVLGYFAYRSLRYSSDGYLWALWVGVGLYLLMPMAGGGDFMAGRFQTIPYIVLVGVIIIRKSFQSKLVLVGLVFSLIFIFHPNNYLFQIVKMREKKEFVQGVAEEKHYYFTNYGFMSKIYRSINGNENLDAFPFRAVQGDSVVFQGMAGRSCYFASQGVYNTDFYGLTDPLIARLPTISPYHWRQGHAMKRYPKGYVESLKEKDNYITDPLIHAMYDDILLATRADLNAEGRWKAIWRLNTGYYKIPRGYESD